MRILIACEFSGVVRTAFASLGHDAWSCDLVPTEIPGPHIVGDVGSLLNNGWDMMIAHPPCTHLAVSGAKHFHRKATEQQLALDFVQLLMNASIPRICIENPVSIISTRIKKPTQVIQPYEFGHIENKRTCLWLKNLPKLIPTNIVPPEARFSFVHREAPGPDRATNRSRTYTGIAKAMATQWGNVI